MGLVKLKITPPKMAARKIKSNPTKTMGQISKSVGKKPLSKVAKKAKPAHKKGKKSKGRKGGVPSSINARVLPAAIKSKLKKTMGQISKSVGKKPFSKVAKNLKLPSRNLRNPKARKGDYQGASIQEFFLLQNKPQ